MSWRPFKSFLNNLQKNAIGATIFGILPDMMNNTEEEEIPSSSLVYNQDDLLGVDDPLSDPLALDDNLDNDEFGTVTDTADTSADGEIILVDVNSLKSAFTVVTTEQTQTNDHLNSIDNNKTKLNYRQNNKHNKLTHNNISGDDSCNTSTTATTAPTLNDTTNILINNKQQLNSKVQSICMQNDLVLSNLLGDSFDIADMPDISDEATVIGHHGDNSHLEIQFEPVNITLGDEVDEVNEEVEGARSDGSDSGFGLELTSIIPDKTVVSPVGSPVVVPGRSNLKRRSSSYDETDVIDAKRPKRNIQFNGVTVYYFPRIQGFTCIPSQGGCTLGMGPQHFYEKSFTLSEHTAEQKRIHRQKMLELNPLRSSSTPIPTTSTSNNNINKQIPVCGTLPICQSTNSSLISGNSSMDDGSSSEESDSEEEVISDNSSSDLDVETNGFLQPVSQRQRRALLKTAGVREIASYEKNECRDIRTSREFCGCNCRDYCDPDTCFCSQSGIKCQVDRASFPCGCTQDGCGNVVGRIEFNPKRVRTHFIHTIMRLELEKKQKKADEHNTLNSYDGRLRLRENGMVDTIDGAGHTTMQRPSLELSNYNNQNMIYSPGPGTLNGIDLPDGSVSVVAGQCRNNYISPVAVGNVGCDPSISESTLDLHYAFRNDYHHVGTAAQSATGSTVTVPQNNYMLYNSSSYFQTSTNSAFNDYTLSGSAINHHQQPPQHHHHQPSYPSFSPTTPPYMVPSLDSANLNDITGNPLAAYAINDPTTNYVHINNATSIYLDSHGDIQTPVTRVPPDCDTNKISSHTRISRSSSTALNNNDKSKAVDYTNSLKTEAQRYDAINDFLENTRATSDLRPGPSMSPFVALTPLNGSYTMNNSDSLLLDNVNKLTTKIESVEQPNQASSATTTTSTISNIINGVVESVTA